MSESSRARDIARVLLMAITPAAAIVILVALTVWWSRPVDAFFGQRGPTDAVDFAVFYSAARLIDEGHGDQIYTPSALADPERDAQPGIREVDLPIPYLNPPYFALILTPLALLPFDLAYQIWTLKSLVLLALECWMIWRITAPLDRRWRLLAVGGIATLVPITFSLALGQFSMIIMTSWTAAFMLVRSGRDRAAGLALAPLLIKPELLIPVLLVLAWKRRTGVFVTLIPVVALALAASVAVLGPHGVLDYPGFVLRISEHKGSGVNEAWMMGWNGLVTQAFGDAHHSPQSIVLYALYLVTFGALLVSWVRDTAPAAGNFPKQWMVLTLVTVLIDPHFYLQDIPMVMAAGVAVGVSVQGHLRPISAAALGMGWIVLALGLTPMRDWNVNIFAVCMVLGLVALVLDATARARLRARDPDTQDAEPLAAAA